MKKFLNLKQAILLGSIVSLTALAHAKNTTETRNFVFNYGFGVESMGITFDTANFNKGQTNVQSATSLDRGTSNMVSVYSGLANSNDVARNFWLAYKYYWQVLEMGPTIPTPACLLAGGITCAAIKIWADPQYNIQYLDFWVEGEMTINGLPVTHSNKQAGFSWAHDGHTGNWVIANDQFVNRSVDNYGLTVATYANGQTTSYCMKSSKKSSYSVTVNKGACDTQNLDFVFNFDGVTVTSVEFKNPYNPAISSGLLSYESISSQSTTYKTTLTFTSQLNDNTSLAKLFDQSYSCNDHCLNLNGVTAAFPYTLDYWAEGDLYINKSRVTKRYGAPDTGFSLAHEHNTRNWWIADNNGTAYSYPHKYYLLDLTTEDGNNYCISGQTGSNYSVDVALGKCNVPAQ